jgi:3-phosphoshikimate 1-carboxyvinyltransferase
MHERPIGDLVDALRRWAAASTTSASRATRRCACTARRRPAGHRAPIRVRGDVSSQFLTALLLALPLVAADGPVVIEVDGELISKPYIEITLKLLARFGIDVQREGWQRFTIPQGSRYRTPGGCMSKATPRRRRTSSRWAPSPPRRSPVRIEGVGSDSIQGDIRFVEAAQAMGAQVRSGSRAGSRCGAAAGRCRRSTWTATTSPTPP